MKIRGITQFIVGGVDIYGGIYLIESHTELLFLIVGAFCFVCGLGLMAIGIHLLSKHDSKK